MEASRVIRRETRPPVAPVPEDGGDDDAILLHNTVYDELRWRMITGRVVPGIGLSTRGVAQELGVSQMPVREALSRLAAEGAIEIRSKRRITVPAMTAERFDDLLRCRLLLEPEAARLALDSIDRQRLKRLKEIDARIDSALRTGDVNAYMEGNFNFHFEIYRAQPRRTLHQLIETLWLQFGPFMRVVYGRFGTAQLVDQHGIALQAIEAGDRVALGRAIHADIEDGMGLIGRNGLE
jgi:DNA-binding GntR family transcriptional regulator